MPPTDSIAIPELDVPFIFSRRPIDVPADLRPAWRIGLLILLLKNCCREGKARFTQLHVLNWGVRSEENREALENALHGSVGADALLVRIEPSLNRAVDLAIGEGLVARRSGDQIELRDSGHALADEIGSDATLYRTEKEFMQRIRKRVTGRFVDGLFG
jgi:hypothetical protein